MMKNKHAELIMQYAEDWAETNEPWTRWQYRVTGGRWLDYEGHPTWREINEYRRKPQTININGFDVPEPMREEPGNGTIYWAVDFCSDKDVEYYEWTDDTFDFETLAKGVCHLTKEAAELHAKALLSFTKAK